MLTLTPTTHAAGTPSSRRSCATRSGRSRSSSDCALRAGWHSDAGVVVLSLWRGNVCAGSFQLPVQEVPDRIDVLHAGFDASYDVALARLRDARFSDAGWSGATSPPA